MWGQGIFFVFGVVLLLTFSITAMVAIDPILTLWALGPIPLVVILSQRLARTVNRRGAAASRQRGKLSATVHEDLAGISVVKSFHLELQRSLQLSQEAARLAQSVLAVQRAAGLYGPLTFAFVAAGTGAALWLGGNAVIEGKMGLGALVQFNMYLGLLAGRIVMLASVIPVFQQGRVAWQRIAAILSHEPAIVDGRGLRLRGAVAPQLAFLFSASIADNIAFGTMRSTKATR